ncbi:discoidin domain-containing receptor 2-like [Hetaerina americana]|uniref:discoidin domain-containing receptor 2-like n=1 Tax=Hetaerina americana TaxID=62018 RepID=UPI003A7F3888
MASPKQDLGFKAPAILVLASLIAAIIPLADSANAGECRAALGMEEGRIPDEAITASSSFDAKSVGPQNARIRQEKNGGAWCPRTVISSEVREYLEVDLTGDHLITRTETQGRFGNGQGQEYAEAFLVEYWRDSLDQWVVYKDSRGEKELTGNSNTYLVVRQELELPFVASRVRFIPYSVHPRTVCMRVEIYGCIWDQGIISYIAPRGDARSPEAGLEDLSYDGVVDAASMKGGLGQLSDGLFGADHFTPDLKGQGAQGNRWVGWLNESRPGQPLEITFEFDVTREFSTLHLHANNMYTRGVQVFSQALVFFSLEGDRYQPSPLKFEPQQDRSSEAARNISVSLRGRVGRHIRLQLFFAARWILLSEVTFDSVPIQGNVSEDLLKHYYLQQDSPEEPRTGGETTHARKEITPATSASSSNHQAYIGLITGVLAVVALLLVSTAVLMVRRSRKKGDALHKHTALKGVGGVGGVTINMRDLKMNMNLMGTPIGNGLTRSIKSKGKGGAGGKGGGGGGNGGGGVYGHVAVGEESDSENSSVYHEPYKLPAGKQEYGCLLKKDISSSKSGEYTDFTSVNSFQDEVKFNSPSFYNLTPPPPPTSRPPPYEMQNNYTATGKNISAATGTLPPSTPAVVPNGAPATAATTAPAAATTNTPLENYYAATDIVKTERREQHFTPGKFTPVKVPDGEPLDGDSPLFEFPRHRLRLVEKLGEGSFGMVHLCEAEAIPDYGTSTFHKKLVIVKSLWRGCNDANKQEFLRETSWLASVRDVNVARVLGVCTSDEPFCVIVEHAEFGDLPRFLQQQARLAAAGGADTNSITNGTGPLSYGSLIYLATQIASGMKYLESRDLVHRDLAARNCVVGKGYSLKITDHAMYWSRFENDYYVSDTKARLPIRWMAWESLLLGLHSSKSDVWSFAVTLWEILMLCAQTPFSELTNEQVVENSNHWYQNDGLQRYLTKPPACPREIYDLMGECWKRHEVDRPRFGEIHLFLQRKNLGYVPATV